MSSFDETTKIWSGSMKPSAYSSDIHISEYILKNLKKTPNRVLQIYDENGSKMTCEELRLKAVRIGQNLHKLGIKRGDVVGFVCTNSEHLCALIHGCILIGAIPNAMALIHDKNDLVHMWRQTEPKFIFCDISAYATVNESLSNINNNATVCTLIERKDQVLFIDDMLVSTGIEKHFEAIKCIGSEDALISIASSSGSSGPPKAVSVSQSSVFRMADTFEGVETRFFHLAQIFRALSLQLFIILPLTKIVRVVTRKAASVECFIELVEKFEVEYAYLPANIVSSALQSPLPRNANLSTLKIVSSAGTIIYPDLRSKFKKIFPDKCYTSSYGMSEVGCFSLPLPSDANDGYTVGRLTNNLLVKIVDENGKKLGIDEAGQICVKSIFPFLGYYKNTKAWNDELDGDNFFKTGDIGYFNQSGILSVIGRMKENFKYNGLYLNPIEIENVIQELEVDQVSVVGIPNEKTMHRTCAVVIKRNGQEHLREVDIISYVANRMPPHKHLYGGVIFVDRLPTTPNGKVIRRLVTDLAVKIMREKPTTIPNGKVVTVAEKIIRQKVDVVV